MTGTHSNITERKQLERALSNTLRVMRALLETLPLPVILRDTERRVTLVNAAFENMFGVPREDIVGKPLDHDPNHAPVEQSPRDRRSSCSPSASRCATRPRSRSRTERPST